MAGVFAAPVLYCCCCGKDLYTLKRALHVLKRALYTLKRALYAFKRALYTLFLIFAAAAVAAALLPLII